MIQCDICSKIYSNKEYKSCPNCKFNSCGKENTQGLIQKDLLLEFPEDKNKELTSECPECKGVTECSECERTVECPECKKIFEYYPEDPCPVGEEGWCHDCLFGVCDYDE